MEDVATGSQARSGSWRETVQITLLLASNVINFLIFHCHFVLFYVLFMIVVTGLIPIMLLNKCTNKNRLLFANSLKHLTKIFGISWELRDGALLRQEHKGVIVANHQSNLDIVGMTNIWHEIGYCSLTAKKELFYFWPIGLSGWLTGVCFLDRSNPNAAWKTLEQTTMRLFEKDTKLWMFPEGTRNRQGQTLLPFKKGAFHMAIAGQVPVLPVIFSPYYIVDKMKYKLRRGGKMVVQAMPPIPTRGLTMDDLDDLVARTHNVMQTAFDALSEEHADSAGAAGMATVQNGSRASNGTWREGVHDIVLLASNVTNFLIFHGHFLLCYALLAIVATGLIPIMLLNKCTNKNSLFFAKSLKHLTKIFGISWELRDGAILRQEHKGIIVANHQSFLDFVGLTNIWHEIGKCSLTIKKEMSQMWPPIGLCGRLTGVCFLDRGNPKAAWKTLEQWKKRSDGDETKLWMYPEGTRNRQGRKLLPFKKGAFRMAIAWQVPILPVIFSPYHFVDEKECKLRRGGKTVVQALSPISTLGLTMDDLDDLIARTRHVMQTAFDALSAEVRTTLDAPIS